jgi:uncharacterized membrane protein
MNDIRILFLLFMIYSFLGWLCESIYCSIPVRKFINRGFLTGPFCPIYGAGAILIVKILAPLKGANSSVIFCGCAFGQPSGIRDRSSAGNIVSH